MVNFVKACLVDNEKTAFSSVSLLPTQGLQWVDILDRDLISTAGLSYTLGLRHALDADHISVRSKLGCRLRCY